MLAEFVNHSEDGSSSSTSPSSSSSSSSSSSCLSSPSSSSVLIDLIKHLLPRVADKISKVRKQAIRGLGNLVVVWNAEVASMGSNVLSSLVNATEDSDAEVAAEAVSSLTRLTGVVTHNIIAPMLMSMCFRIRPAFDRSEESIRRAAFTLFGTLCRFGACESSPHEVDRDFAEQIHINLPMFIVHLNDSDAKVRAFCLEAMKKIGELLKGPIVDVIQNATADPANYDEFIFAVCPVLASEYPDRFRAYMESTCNYFTSKYTGLRANSSLLVGALLSNAKPNTRRTLNIPSLCSHLLKLLDEPTPLVRLRTAKALSMLHDL